MVFANVITVILGLTVIKRNVRTTVIIEDYATMEFVYVLNSSKEIFVKKENV
jgi:hypothetical protein